LSYDKTKQKIKDTIVKMERIGIRKEIDKLGRICIPKEIRNMFNLECNVELQITNEGILIKNPEYILVKKENGKVSSGR